MAAAPKENLGMFPCPCCKEPTALKKSATGKLSFACQDADCEMTGFSDQSSGAARKWMGQVSRRQVGGDPLPLVVKKPTEPARTPPAAKPAPAPVPVPNVLPKPAPRPAFDLGAL